MIASILAIGYKVPELREIMINANFEDFMDDRVGLLRDAVSIMSKYGYCEGKVLREFLENIVKKKTGNALYTFADLYKDRKIKLVIIGCNVNRRREIRFSREIYPNMSIVNAIRISMALPLVFRPIRMNKEYYVDGGIINNYPMEVFHGVTVGIKLLSVNEKEKVDNIVDYISTVVNISANKAGHDDRSIVVITRGMEANELMEEGRKAVDDWLGTGTT